MKPAAMPPVVFSLNGIATSIRSRCNSLFMSLALPVVAAAARARAKGVQLAYIVDTNDNGVKDDLLDAEHEKWDINARFMGFDRTYMLANAQTLLNTSMGPYGYVASVHPDQPFNAWAFEGFNTLFRGVSYVEVAMPYDDDAAIPEAKLMEMRRNLNLLIRDASTNPALLRSGPHRATVDSGWMPSLGQASWIGLYKGEVQSQKNAKSKVIVKTYLVVVAGLDPETYHDLELDMYRCSNSTSHTMSSMFGERGVLDEYRRISVQIRSRLMALAVQALKVKLVDATIEQHPTAYQYTQASSASPLAEEAMVWLGLDQIPAWLRIPVADIRDCGPTPDKLRGFAVGSSLPAGDARVQRHPLYVQGAHDTLTCDVRPVQVGDLAMMGVYMGASCTTSTHGVPYTTGPCGPIVIYNVGYPTLWNNSKFDAFPSEAIHEYTPGKTTTRAVTWERADLKENRNVAATWTYNEPLEKPRPANAGGLAPASEVEPVDMSKRYGDVVDRNPALVLRGMVIRVSAWDPAGYAIAPPEGIGRMHSARVCDYQPLC